MRHGVEDGLVQLWWEGDILDEEGQYREGRPDGTWRRYRDGVLLFEHDQREFPKITEVSYEDDGSSNRATRHLDTAMHTGADGSTTVGCGHRPEALPESGVEGTSTVLVLDTSGSLGHSNDLELRRAASTLAEALDPDDELSIVTASTVAVTALPLTRVGSVDLRVGLAAIRRGGGSDLVPALAVAHAQLAHAKGRRHVIVFTDAQVPFHCADAWVRRLRSDATLVSFVAPRHGFVDGVERLAAWGGDPPTFIDDLAALANAVTESHRRLVTRMSVSSSAVP